MSRRASTPIYPLRSQGLSVNLSINVDVSVRTETEQGEETRQQPPAMLHAPGGGCIIPSRLLMPPYHYPHLYCLALHGTTPLLG